MVSVTLRLNNREYSKITKLAKIRKCSVDTVIKDAIARTKTPAVRKDCIIGLFADEPELVDAIAHSAMQAREMHPLRVING